MRRRSVLVIALLLGTGCYGYHLDRTPAPMPRRDQVRVRFQPPRRVDVVTGSDTVRLSDVMWVEGRVLTARGDTLTLAVRDIGVDGGVVSRLVPGSSTAVVTLGAGAATEVRRLNKLETMFAVVALTTVTTIALGVLLLFWQASTEDT